MRTGITLAGLVGFALLAAPFARAAEPQGIEHEKPMVLRGKVVDLLCGVTGNCPPDCGNGKRILGLLTAEGKLIATVKSPTDFAGAIADLLPHCNREVELDGLMVENPAMRLYLVQGWRRDKADPWTTAAAFTPVWTAQNAPAEDWYKADPRARRLLEADGVFGIPGLTAKKKP